MRGACCRIEKKERDGVRIRRRKTTVGVFIKTCFVLVFTCVFLWLVKDGTRILMEWLYPMKYSDIISAASDDYGVPEDVIYAVIRTESSFKPEAVSHAGAIGLMQIMPETYEWLLKLMEEELPDDAVYYPEVNIRCGVYYLSYLKRELDDWDTVFAAYNAGIGRVKGWLENDSITENGMLVNIPIEETASYVIKIAKAREIYQKF